MVISPMKIPQLLLVPAVCLLFGLSTSLSLQAEETSIWLAGKARTVSGGILLPDSEGSFDLEMKDAAGVTLGEKPPGGGDTKSLEFSGTQTSVFRSVTPYPAVGGTLKVELEAMIPEGGGGEDATLLRHGSMWEIRYTAKNMSYSFIIWHDNNVFTDVKVPVKFDDWNTITATYTGEELILQVGKTSAKAVPKDVLRQDTGPASLLLGASTTKVSEEALPRLFHGSIANIRISLE